MLASPRIRIDSHSHFRDNIPMPNISDALYRNLAQGILDGLHIGAQAYASINGKPILDIALGESATGIEMTPDTLMIWLSATKPITAVCIAQLWERGKLTLDDPVAKHIPQFANNGKESITIRHLLTHTAGIRGAASNTTPDPWDVTIAKICAAKIEPGWIPGKKAGYHVASTWFLLGELIRRLDGRPFTQYVREEIFLPLKMPDCYVGIPPEKYAAYGPRMGILQNTDTDHIRPHGWDTPQAAAQCSPGGTGRGPARQLARFYEMMLNGGTLDGAKIISPQTAEAFTARHRVGMFDQTFSHIMDWGLGFIPSNNQYGIDTIRYGYSPLASWRTYGHGGNQSSVAFADPKHKLAAVIIFNGTPGDAEHDQRLRSALTVLYENLPTP
jgi:CubicO group peptidase (beta-lactamase class C family)